ncbi:SDR family NAD(P)-dependent oxidoreductase [Kutzneria buriramensis]|uniref:Probable oxidoreductase n=1 Tax=Kutzneria buriramensis TaxID=1045776 RepID=A0A3E0I798_9PSEU|nr:SDR family NAD(P)-dependent oxidoreductase [Kutzneria buriramensis]REH54025.1 NAD(P)-dependent dehydrogenase (short-subunit alcohol dehydrogenase family) [Kutzneria buriramensis]
MAVPFGFSSTAAEVIDGVDLAGKRAVVTGGASGIGVETARALAGAHAEVTLAVRDVEAGRRVAADLPGDVRVAHLDLADRASVAKFVADWEGPLHILVCNAGIMATPELRTPEGWEMQFATNHLGHFALAVGLHDVFAPGSRVVVVSSRGHLSGDIDLDDVNFEHRPYDRWQAYSASKTANVLFAVEAARRWAADGIAVNALMPGRIRTNLMRHIGDETTAAAPSSFGATDPALMWKTIEQGAATSVLLAASPYVEGITGRYFEDCQPADLNEPGTLAGVAPYAVDPARATRLWRLSRQLLTTPTSPA